MLHLKVLAALLATPLLPITPPLPAIPLLSMTVVGSVARPRPGDRITWTVTVANRDRLPMSMTIELVAPAWLDPLDALDGGRRQGHELTWTATIESQQRASVRFSGVPVTDGDVSITACAYLDTASRPTACASDVTTVALPPPATGAQIAGRYAAFFGPLLVLMLGWRWWRRRGARSARVAASARTAPVPAQAAAPGTYNASESAETAASGTPMR